MALVRTELRFGAWFDEDREFLATDDADAIYATLRDEIAWEQRAVPRQGVVTGPRVNVTFRRLHGPPGCFAAPAPGATP